MDETELDEFEKEFMKTMLKIWAKGVRVLVIPDSVAAKLRELAAVKNRWTIDNLNYEPQHPSWWPMFYRNTPVFPESQVGILHETKPTSPMS